MYVQIFAKSENGPSTGKTSWFNTGDKLPPIELVSTNPTHLGSPPWHLRLRASESRELTSGERGGEMRGKNYTLEFELTPADLATLVNFAISRGLIEVAATPQALNPK